MSVSLLGGAILGLVTAFNGCQMGTYVTPVWYQRMWWMCQEEDGLKTVMSELKEGLGVGSAYAFVAGKVKDYGAINVTLQLYLKALEFEPLNTSFALNYLHTLEIKQDFMDVLEFARGFCERMTGQMCSSIDEQEVSFNPSPISGR